jgi:vancomycin resistance protein YoaR
MRAEVGVEPARRARARHADRGRFALVRWPWRAVLYSLAALVLALIALGLVYSGSATQIADGVRLAGVDVGGMTAAEAERALEQRASGLGTSPVVFTADGHRWAIQPAKLEVRIDWGEAARRAVAAGDGPIGVRGLERLKIRLFGTDVEPRPDYYEPALRFQVSQMAEEVDVPPRDAAIALRSNGPVVVPAEDGLILDRGEAEQVVLDALAGFERRPVVLPIRREEPEVVASELAPALAQTRTALSAPVLIVHGSASWRVTPRDLAGLLVLPAKGETKLRVGGPAATRYLENLSRGVAERPRSADFAVTTSGRVRVVPAQDGRDLDVPATAKALLAAALSETNRRAKLVITPIEPRLTTEEAKGLGIRRQLASYTTLYSGTNDRIRNLQLAIQALDGTLVPPGGTFSFNRAVGPRTKERGYRPAPVIVNGEYEDGIGGGVSQVGTTMFNAAWEAGLKITERTAHALYISRYPLGRDATVVYPDIDVRFRNDTPRHIYVQAAYGETGIAISLLGAGRERRVVSRPGELRDVAPPKTKLVPDPNLFEGEKVVEDAGEPARAITVTRTVYVGDEVLYDEQWSTYYRSEPKIVRVGTQPKPAEEEPTTTTTPTTTGATTTGPAPTTTAPG